MSNRYTGLVAKLIVLLGVIDRRGGADGCSIECEDPGGGRYYSGQAAVVQINGKTYVDVESVARLTGGSLSFQANQTTLTLPAPPASVQPAPAPVAAKPPAFSVEFLKAGIEEMSVIREWRSALVNAVQTNSPVNDDWVSGYRRAADSRLSLAEAAASTVPDQQAAVMLRTEFNNMRQMSDQASDDAEEYELYLSRLVR